MRVEFAPGQTAAVCILDGSGKSFTVTLVAGDSRHLSLRSAVPLTRGMPLRIQWESFILLAEVILCSSTETCEVLIRHALRQSDVEFFRKVWI